MKKLLFLLNLVILGFGLPAHADNPQRVTMHYIDYVTTNAHTFNNLPILSKEQRVSSAKGNIVLAYDESLPDSIKIALSVAKEMWEAKIQNKIPIYIDVVFESLESDVAVETDVVCLEAPFLGCPSSLAAQLLNQPYEDDYSSDGVIVFNSNIEWNCNFTDDMANEYNITTMALRGIARCLGFGSSIYEEGNNKFFYYFTWPTAFDNILHSSLVKLSDLQEGTTEMARFVTSDDVYLDTEHSSYKIYAPTTYLPYQSLCFLDSNNSIMSYSLSRGNVALSIDDSTLDILKALGWDLPSSGYAIVCSDISKDGIGSSYTPHTFSLNSGNDAVSHYNWKFLLKNKQGEYVQVSQSSSQSFTIGKISSPGNYYTNTNGDLEGRVECEYVVNGISHNASPFSVSLEQKPKILSIENIVVNQNSPAFSVTFNVNYVGADRVNVEVEEEFDAMFRVYRYDEPFIAHSRIDDLSMRTYTWITVVVTNKYGSVYETLEFEPEISLYANSPDSSSKEDESMITGNDKIQIKRINGEIVFDGKKSALEMHNLSPGLYIKREYNDRSSKTSKIFIK